MMRVGIMVNMKKMQHAHDTTRIQLKGSIKCKK